MMINDKPSMVCDLCQHCIPIENSDRSVCLKGGVDKCLSKYRTPNVYENFDLKISLKLQNPE